MTFISKLYPTHYIESVYEIDTEELRSRGKKLLLFDIDNTLVPHDAKCDERARAFLNLLSQKGFKLGLVSNNEEPRVKSFSENAGGLCYSFLSHKPSPAAYLRLCKDFSIEASEAAFFGDQLFTDIWGANNAGIESYLVSPIDKNSEPLHIKLKRILEKPILYLYKKGFFL